MFDKPDERGPSEHWSNTSGTALYDPERVAIAKYRIGKSEEKPSPKMWSKWRNSLSPTATPALTLDFHHMSDAYVHGAADEFWSLRLSHPIAGRPPGTKDRERQILEPLLNALWQVAFPDTSVGNVFESLSELAEVVVREKPKPWAAALCVRRVSMKSYLSKAKSPKAVKRALQGLALIHSGTIRDPRGRKQDLLDWLIESPRMRFDFLELEADR